MARKHTKPKYLSEHLSVYPKATLYFGVLSRHKWLDCLDLSFELRYTRFGGCFLAAEFRKDERYARQRLYLLGAESNVVIVKGWPHDFFECWRFFDDDEHDPELLYSTLEEWNSAFDSFLRCVQEEGHEILGDFRQENLLHPALLGRRLDGSSPNKPEPNERRRKLPTSLDDFKIFAAEEVSAQAGEMFVEGASTSILVNKYERDPAARRRCIEHYGGYSCQICQVDLSLVYPGVGNGDFIHVHHLRPLSSIGQSYQVDPVHDLLPVCPNCHAMLHRRDPPYEPDEIRAALKRGREPSTDEAEDDDELPF